MLNINVQIHFTHKNITTIITPITIINKKKSNFYIHLIINVFDLYYIFNLLTYNNDHNEYSTSFNNLILLTWLCWIGVD